MQTSPKVASQLTLCWQGVSPQDLSLEQLSQVKKQLEQVLTHHPMLISLRGWTAQEVQQLDANLQTFKSVVGKCEESKESLEAIVPENAGSYLTTHGGG